ncbi:aa3-type cytochrome c oxidase subunit IV [Sphingobium sp. Cam5-1]|nr:aa3-type cytochrome c oxidase subunit IV [Sphingobium sp. Cam5-1]
MEMASEGNMESATQTYAGFVTLVKRGTIACVVLAAIVVLLISS